MQVTIDVPDPKPGQKVYVHSTGTIVGGLGTISIVFGSRVFIKEAPDVPFDWPTLVKNQLDYVQLHSGSKVIPKLQKTG